MRVLVACEFSGVVRRAFQAAGHQGTVSVDYLPAEDGANSNMTGGTLGFHQMGDVLQHLQCFGSRYDLMIAHPPCTHLAVSGARWFKDKQKEQAQALAFVQALMNSSVPRIAIENPVSIISSKIRKPDQIVQPFNFGDPYRKTTCLWLKNLPLLKPTSDMTTGEQKCWKEPPSPDRWKNRSRTYPGFAKAMAEQWGSIPTQGKI